MDEIAFEFQGSAESPYLVTFRRHGAEVIATCTCPAGENGQHCKHRIGILAGSTDGIVSTNANDVSLLLAWLPGTKLAAALAAVAAADEKSEMAKRFAMTEKKKLARVLLGQ